MIILADSDILYKLACCDLLQELLLWMKAPPNEVFVLAELRFQMKSKLKNNNEAMMRLNAFLKMTQEVPTAEIGNLEKFSSLDVGEQKLLAVFVENSDNARLITGDKRALQGISRLAENDDLLNSSLSGRVDCLEKVMLALIDAHGFDVINTKVTPYSSVDGVLKVAFGRDEFHAKEALNSFLSGLKRDVLFL